MREGVGERKMIDELRKRSSQVNAHIPPLIPFSCSIFMVCSYLLWISLYSPLDVFIFSLRDFLVLNFGWNLRKLRLKFELQLGNIMKWYFGTLKWSSC